MEENRNAFDRFTYRQKKIDHKMQESNKTVKKRLKGSMPEISRFLGIIIKMFHDDHAPPHFHAYYQNFSATFSIRTGQIIDGKLPQKQLAFIKAWALLHEKELMNNWKSLVSGKEANKINPLR